MKWYQKNHFTASWPGDGEKTIICFGFVAKGGFEFNIEKLSPSTGSLSLRSTSEEELMLIRGAIDEVLKKHNGGGEEVL